MGDVTDGANDINTARDLEPKPLREWRAEHMLSIRDLALRAEVSPSTIFLIEAGRSTPRPSVGRRLAEALNVEPRAITELLRTIRAYGGRG
jgi:DNA-binding XRE family transcriptional regulator